MVLQISKPHCSYCVDLLFVRTMFIRCGSSDIAGHSLKIMDFPAEDGREDLSVITDMMKMRSPLAICKETKKKRIVNHIY